MSQGTCLCAQIIQPTVGRPKSVLGISAYVRRIHPCAEMIQITSSLVRIYAPTPILYLMDFLRCTQIIHKSKLFNAHVSKKSTTGWFAPCAKTPKLDQYIPHFRVVIQSFETKKTQNGVTNRIKLCTHKERKVFFHNSKNIYRNLLKENQKRCSVVHTIVDYIKYK